MLTYLTRIAAAAAAFFSLISVSQATLIGDTVVVSYHFPNLATSSAPVSVTVGAGAEVTCPSTCLGGGLLSGESIDIGDFTIAFNFVQGNFVAAAFTGYVLESLNLGSPIVGFLLATSISGVNASQIAFGPDFLSLNMAGFIIPSGGGSVQITLLTAVPEPATLLILATGLGAAALLRRRRRS